MPSKSKRLRIMAGPNGSGKSTVINKIRDNYYCGPFVNADLIELSLREKKLLNLSDFNLDLSGKEFNAYIKDKGASWKQKAQNAGSEISLGFSANNLVVKAAPNVYDAAIAADFVRYSLLDKQETFTFETVLSHPSKIEFLQLANKAGYKNYLYFICTVDPEINKERIKHRVAMGGHNVPTDKIVKRYYESLSLLPALVPVSYRCFLFDNSAPGHRINLIAEIDNGKKLTIHNEDVPWWIEEYVVKTLFS